AGIQLAQRRDNQQQCRHPAPVEADGDTGDGAERDSAAEHGSTSLEIIGCHHIAQAYYTILELNGGLPTQRRPPYLSHCGCAYQRLLARRCCWKQSEQYTGLSPRGTKGTCASLPHDAHVVVCISRGPLL